jgi:hypothetical protein
LWTAVCCQCVVGFCSAILNLQLIDFYASYFQKQKNDDTLLWMITCFLSSGIFYLKEISPGFVQLATLYASALICFAGLCWLMAEDARKLPKSIWKGLRKIGEWLCLPSANKIHPGA